MAMKGTIAELITRWRGLGVHVISRAKSVNDHVFKEEGKAYALTRAPGDNRYHWLFCQKPLYTHVDLHACNDLCKGGAICFASCFECVEHCRIVSTADGSGRHNPVGEKELGTTYNPNAAEEEGWL